MKKRDKYKPNDLQYKHLLHLHMEFLKEDKNNYIHNTEKH